MIRIPNGHILAPESIEKIDSVANVEEIQISKGLAKAVTTPELFLPYNGGLLVGKDSGDLKRLADPKNRVDRDFDKALHQRVMWAEEHGQISTSDHGDLDSSDRDVWDRKLRFDGFTLRNLVTGGQCLDLRFGPSHFKELLTTNYEGMKDPAVYGRLTAKGQRNFKDERAYFADCLGMNVVLKTSDEQYLLFVRPPSIQLWPARWNNIGCLYVPDFSLFEDKRLHIPMPENAKEYAAGIKELSKGHEAVSQRLISSFAYRILTEIQKVAGINVDEVKNLRLIGISYGMSSVDLNYEAETTVDQEYLIEKWLNRTNSNALEFISFRSFGELVDIVQGKKALSPFGNEAVPSDGNLPFTQFVPTGLAGLLIHIGLNEKDALEKILKTPAYQLYG